MVGLCRALRSGPVSKQPSYRYVVDRVGAALLTAAENKVRAAGLAG